MFLFNVFSIIRTVPTVKIKPVIKKISFIISPPQKTTHNLKIDCGQLLSHQGI